MTQFQNTANEGMFVRLNFILLYTDYSHSNNSLLIFLKSPGKKFMEQLAYSLKFFVVFFLYS